MGTRTALTPALSRAREREKYRHEDEPHELFLTRRYHSQSNRTCLVV
jgi:hypothetical protein